MEIELFLSKLKIGQLKKLVSRYELHPKYKRRKIIQKALVKYMKKNGIGECPICFESNNYSIAVATPCAHIFCDICLVRHLYRNDMCPICREPTDLLYIVDQTYRITNYPKEWFVIDVNVDIDDVTVDAELEAEPIRRTHPITLIFVMSMCALNVCLTLFVFYRMIIIVHNEIVSL
jgi:hypothetical protein